MAHRQGQLLTPAGKSRRKGFLSQAMLREFPIHVDPVLKSIT